MCDFRSAYFKVIVYIFILIIPLSSAYSQVRQPLSEYGLTAYFTKLYRQDQTLINGAKYYNLHYAAIGDPFFINDKSSPGRIVMNGTEYNNIRLKYDICNQQIILEYSYAHGGINQLVLHDKYISEFEIFEKLFRKYNFPLTGENFFQVIASGNLVMLLSWKKELVPGGSFNQTAYEYTREKRKTYLLFDDKLHVIKGNKSFIKHFYDHDSEIRKFLKLNHINVRNTSDAGLSQLIDFCSNLPETSKNIPQQ